MSKEFEDILYESFTVLVLLIILTVAVAGFIIVVYSTVLVWEANASLGPYRIIVTLIYVIFALLIYACFIAFLGAFLEG